LIDGEKEFTAGVWFGSGEGDGDVPFAKDGDRFWAASDDLKIAQGSEEFFLGMSGLDHVGKSASTDAGEKNHDIEIVLEEGVGEVEGFGVGGERDFAHGWGVNGLAAVGLDEANEFGAAAAFEGEDG